MDRIYEKGAAQTVPQIPAAPSPGYPIAGNPATGTPATKPGVWWYHMVMEELMAIIAAAGIQPDGATLNQLATAIQSGKLTGAICGGTVNALTADYPIPVKVLKDQMVLAVRVPGPNTQAAVTFTPSTSAINPIAPAGIVKGANQALGVGDLCGDHLLQWNATYGKWVLLNPATIASVQGVFKNLQASATGTNSSVGVSADEIVVEDSGGAFKTLRNLNLSINAAANGANGVDTGAVAASTWYSVWVIYNPTTQNVAGLLSLSTTAPTLPNGYTMKARVGWTRTDSTANKYPLSFVQFGKRSQYKIAIGSNVTTLPQISSGVQGSISAPTFISIPVSAFIPPTASRIQVQAWNAGSVNSTQLVAPNSSYGNYGSGAKSAPIVASLNGSVSGSGMYQQGEFIIESSNIYVAADQAGCGAAVLGWEDNL